MRRWLLNFFAVLSLPLLLGTMGVWVHSYFSGYHIAVRAIASERDSGVERMFVLLTGQGRAHVSLSTMSHALATDPSWHGDAVWRPMFYHSRTDRSLARESAQSDGIRGAFGSTHSFNRFLDDFYIGSRSFVIPLWLSPVPFAVFPGAWLGLAFLRRRRVRQGHCIVCGYDLRASPAHCPECGTMSGAGPLPASKSARLKKASPLVAAVIFCLLFGAGLTYGVRICWRNQQRISDRCALERSLWTAVDHDDIAGVRTALAAGVSADLHVRGRSTLTWAGERNCSRGMFCVLIENGANVNFVDDEYKTPLYFAIEMSDVDLVRLLLERGANPNVPVSFGVMRPFPLISLVGDESSEIVQLLLDHGANANAQTRSGNLLSHALLKERWKVVIMLLQRGATAPPDDLENGLKLARVSGRRDAEKMLLKAGAKDSQPKPGELLRRANFEE